MNTKINTPTIGFSWTNILTTDEKARATEIFKTIQGANSILMHCHPSPDPDSLGSTLAMKFALESIGKKVTIIAGDSKIPQAFMHFPGADTILPQNYIETDLTQFDLFLILDCGSTSMISRIKEVTLPPIENPSLKTIVIDHHASNSGYGQQNIVATQYISTTQLLFDLFQEWGINITKEIAINMYVGLFTDSGGFRYDKVSPHTFFMSGVLNEIAPEMIDAVKVLENSGTAGTMTFLGLALNQKKVFIGNETDPSKGAFVISYITYDDIVRLGLGPENWSGNEVCNILKSVIGWNVVALAIEQRPSEVKVSFRTRDVSKFEVSKVAIALGGGGHKAAAAAVIKKPIAEAIDIIETEIRKQLFS